MIEFESVTKTFRDGTAAVVDLTLQVPTGATTAVLGPSGGGATTALRMVNRLVEPSQGRVVWDGTPLRSRRKTALRRQLGYVTRGGGLFPHRTVLDNIAVVPGLLGWSRSKTDRHALELLDRVGLDRGLAKRYPDQLAPGQPERVGLARALAADPSVLLLEEPFAGTGPTVRRDLQTFLLDLQRGLGTTILLVTDDPDEALLLGDQVAVLGVDGRLAQVGPPAELLEHPAGDYVDGLVGRDRGFRSLTHLPASGLALSGVRVVRDPVSATSGEPTLVVDADARPLGWVDAARPDGLSPLGATFDVEHGSLRGALDAALTSPYGLAVGVAASTGRYAGVATAAVILDQVAGARAARSSEPVAVSAPDLDEQRPAAPAPDHEDDGQRAAVGDETDPDLDPAAPGPAALSLEPPSSEPPSSEPGDEDDRPDLTEADRHLLRELDAADARR